MLPVINDYNCRHSAFPIIMGVSKPAYTEEELANIDPPPITYEGKTYTAYEAQQQMRKMERAMRKQKDLCVTADAAGDTETFTTASIKLRRQKDIYEDFCRAAGTYTEYERTLVAGYTKSLSAKTGAVTRAQNAFKNAQVTLTNGGNGGIIKSQDRSHAQKASNPDVQEILNKYPVIEGQHSYLDDIKATNPHYSESKKNGDKYYTYNCQRCVNAYEARRRGYDVTAGKRILKNDTLPCMTNAKGWANVYEDGVNNLIPCFSSTSEGVRKKVSEQIASWGNGARCIVRVQWRGGGGHVFIGECHDGTVMFLDPQNANLDASDYFSLAKVNKTYVLRTDDKEFSTLIQECCDYIIQGDDK